MKTSTKVWHIFLATLGRPIGGLACAAGVVTPTYCVVCGHAHMLTSGTFGAGIIIFGAILLRHAVRNT